MNLRNAFWVSLPRVVPENLISEDYTAFKLAPQLDIQRIATALTLYCGVHF